MVVVMVKGAFLHTRRTSSEPREEQEEKEENGEVDYQVTGLVGNH